MIRLNSLERANGEGVRPYQTAKLLLFEAYWYWYCYLYNHRTKKGEFLVESKQTLGISADEPLVILKTIIAALVVYVIGSACSNFDDEAMHIITNVIYIIAGLLGAIATYSLIRSLIAAKRESVLSQLMKKYVMDQLDLKLVK